MPSDRRREAILEAVSRQVVDSEMTMTTKELAQAAGVAEGTLFRVFDSKEELLIAAFSHRLEQMARNDDADGRLAALHELPSLLATDLISSWVHMMVIFRRFLRGSEGQRAKGAVEAHKSEITRVKNTYQERLSYLTRCCHDLIGPDADQLRMPVDTVVAFVQSVVMSMAMAREFHDFGITADDASSIVMDGVLRH